MTPAVSTVPSEPRDPQRIYSIAELAREFAITARTIRFYEDEGLIKPRRQGLTRLYSAGDRTRLGWILRGKRLGFSLAEIKELLDLYQVDRTGVQQLHLIHVRMPKDRQPDHIAIAVQRIGQIL